MASRTIVYSKLSGLTFRANNYGGINIKGFEMLLLLRINLGEDFYY